MEDFPILRFKKINGSNGLLIALRHNKRELQALRGAQANIDPTKSNLNYTLTEIASAESLDRLAKSKLALAGIAKPRKNAVVAVEIMFSLPITYHHKDTRTYFGDCLEWVKQNFAGELISFDIHLDESAPHAHVLILPLIQGKLQGSDMVGGRGNIYRLRNIFFRDVANHYGLNKPKKSVLSDQVKTALMSKILKSLRLDSVTKSGIWPIVRNHIELEPLLYAEFLGIKPMTKILKKSFVDYKRAKGRGSFNR
jgi:hypothetical protein